MESPQQIFTGVFIPAKVWNDSRLSCGHRCLWAEINALGGQSGNCFASNDYLGQQIGVSGNRVSKMIAELISWETLKIVSFNGRVRLLQTLSDAKADLAKTPRQTWRKRQGRLGENANLDIENENRDKEKPKTVTKSSGVKAEDYISQLPSEFNTRQMRDALQLWINHRGSNHKKITPEAVRLQSRDMRDWGVSGAIKSIETSVSNGYQGLFPPKTSFHKPEPVHNAI